MNKGQVFVNDNGAARACYLIKRDQLFTLYLSKKKKESFEKRHEIVS